jgi:hypothetical protein
MQRETATDLAKECTKAARAGKAFPTIWHTLIKGHALLEGIPRQKLEGARSILVMPLITGQQLIYDGDAKEFRLV